MSLMPAFGVAFFLVSLIIGAVRYVPVDPQNMPTKPFFNLEPTEKPDKSDRAGLDSQVRIYSALLDQGAFGESFGSQAATSTAPAIAAFNRFGQCIGVANTFWNLNDDARIENGAFKDFTVFQTAGPGQEIEYLQVYATGTPICIPGITLTLADGAPKGILGGFGRACGAAWYYSNVGIGENHTPDCIWLDSGKRSDQYTNGDECRRLKAQCDKLKNVCGPCDEGDKTLKYQFPSDLRYLPKAMQFTLSPFSHPSDIGNIDPPDLQTLCGENSLTFRHFLNVDIEFRPKLEPYWDDSFDHEIYPETENPNFKTDNTALFEQGSDLSIKKRSESASEVPSQPAHAWNFYVSSATVDHSAMQLCASITSLGPDFYSEYERKFCDMGVPGSGSKNLYDVCDDRNIVPCWNKDTHQLTGVEGKEKRSSKSYSHKVEWKTDGIKSIVKLLGSAGSAGNMSSVSHGMTGLLHATVG